MDILNILSAAAYLAIKIEHKGFDYVMKTHSLCEKWLKKKWNNSYLYLFIN